MGASARLAVTGNQVWLVGATSANGGLADVYLETMNLNKGNGKQHSGGPPTENLHPPRRITLLLFRDADGIHLGFALYIGLEYDPLPIGRKMRVGLRIGLPRVARHAAQALDAKLAIHNLE